MKKKFYSMLFNGLNLYGEVFVISVIKGTHNGEKIIGQKLLKYKEEVIMGDNNLKDFWDEILVNIDFNKGTYILKLKGEIELFIEQLVGNPQLVIFGGGHIALPLCQMGKILEFSTTIIDTRKEFANKDRFKEADEIICEPFEEAFNKIKFNKNTYFVIVTRGHKDDRRCLENILRKESAYVGMIGSRAKVAFVKNNMIENGYSKEELEKVYSPIGLKIGAKTPAEIAVSILGEIIQVKNEKEFSCIEDNILKAICDKNEPMVLATIVEKHGSGPRGAGTKMLIFKDKSFIGTVGGGSVENAVYEKALELIESKNATVEGYDLSNTASAKLGMACGGKVKVLFEFIE